MGSPSVDLHYEAEISKAPFSLRASARAGAANTEVSMQTGQGTSPWENAVHVTTQGEVGEKGQGPLRGF